MPGQWVGSVSVSDANVVTKDGMCGVFYDAIEAQEGPTLPNPLVPSASYTGTLEEWTAYMLPKVVAVKRGWARTATALANGEACFSGLLTTNDAVSQTIVSLLIPEGVMFHYEYSIQGVSVPAGPANRATLLGVGAGYRAPAGTLVATVATNLANSITAGGASVTTDGASSLLLNGQGQALTAWKWRAQLRVVSSWLYTA
jgi:voltage-gated potassium channel Kch